MATYRVVMTGVGVVFFSVMVWSFLYVRSLNTPVFSVRDHIGSAAVLSFLSQLGFLLAPWMMRRRWSAKVGVSVLMLPFTVFLLAALVHNVPLVFSHWPGRPMVTAAEVVAIIGYGVQYCVVWRDGRESVGQHAV